MERKLHDSLVRFTTKIEPDRQKSRRAWSGSSMILWLVLRFGICFLRAGNVRDGQIANWRASCVNLLILRFVLRFGIYFLRAGIVRDGQIANWRASCVNPLILWFVLRFGIYFLRAGIVRDGQIANWQPSCVNLLIRVCPVAVKTQKLTKIQASVERKLHDSLVRITIRNLFFTSRKRK